MNILAKIFAALVLCGTIVTSVEAGTRQKPQAPAEILITPLLREANGKTIDPGEIVTLKISARAFIEVDELLIETFLPAGSEFVSGDRIWKGSAARNESKEITLTIRSPLQGSDTVQARVSLFRAGERLTSKQTNFDFFTKSGSSPNKPARPSRKDSKGREIVTY